MKKNELIKKLEDAVTDMEFKHYIKPDFDLEQKWNLSYGAYVDDCLDIDRMNIKNIKKDRDIIGLFIYADEFQKTIIWKGKKFKENREVEYKIFYNLDTDSVNILMQFYYSPTHKVLETLYDTAKQSIKEIVEDYYAKLATFLKNEETEKQNK